MLIRHAILLLPDLASAGSKPPEVTTRAGSNQRETMRPIALDSPFYRLFLDWAVYPVVLMATAATVIASQAVISGAFSLSQQAMQLSLLPRLDVHQTSKEAIGQVYEPQINWLLLICVLGLVLAFGSSDNLAAAYGIAVSGTMVITTGLLAIVARRLWQWSLPFTALVMGSFTVVDLTFFAANAIKIPQGGWFPLLVGAIVFTLMSTWLRRRQIVLERTREDNPDLRGFIATLDGAEYPRVAGTAVYLAARRGTAPYSLMDNLRHNKVLHERIVLLTVMTERQPFVPEEERMMVEGLGKGFTEMTLRFGFAQAPSVPAAFETHHGQFPIDLAQTSSFLGRENPVPTT